MKLNSMKDIAEVIVVRNYGLLGALGLVVAGKVGASVQKGISKKEQSLPGTRTSLQKAEKAKADNPMVQPTAMALAQLQQEQKELEDFLNTPIPNTSGKIIKQT
jgi:hypothetical protein